jgi:hypothetical protein
MYVPPPGAHDRWQMRMVQDQPTEGVRQIATMADNVLAVSAYSLRKGVVAPAEGSL